MSQRHKHILDRAVAAELGISQQKVGLITSEFLRQFAIHLVDYGVLSVEGLGRFQVEQVEPRRTVVLTTGTFKKGQRAGKRRVEVRTYIRVHFSKGRHLKRLLDEQYKESTMEKYGVDENVDQKKLEKQAAEGCPECGRPLTKHGSVLICPEHGSEPFENGKT